MALAHDFDDLAPRSPPDPYQETVQASRTQAEMLALKIRDFWAARGFSVEIHIRYCGFNSRMRSARFDLRSDLVNALPKDWNNARKPAE